MSTAVRPAGLVAAADLGSSVWEPLVEYRRNDVAENTIHGAVAWVSGRKLVHSFGGNVRCYGRSMMKPIALKVFAREFATELNPDQQAIVISSHNGDAEHVRVVKSLLNESEMGLLQCPFALPLIQFGRQVRRPRRWYHTCSGEHAGIVRGCKLKGWSRVGYVWPHHPFTQAYIDLMRRYLGADWQVQHIAKDGCGLPTISMTVNELALLYASLVTEREHDWVWKAMIDHPDLIGGFNRLDSTIIKSGQGRVIAKEGADGLLGLAVEHPDFPEGLGIVIKIAHGWDPQGTWYVARLVLGVLGFELRNPYILHRQKPFVVADTIPPALRDRISAVDPWDEWDPDVDRWFFAPEEFMDGKHPNEP
jgi:L-asparaginase II